MDIGKFCADVIDKNKNDVELEGKVINCLKKQFAVKVSYIMIYCYFTF